MLVAKKSTMEFPGNGQSQSDSDIGEGSAAMRDMMREDKLQSSFLPFSILSPDFKWM